MGRRPPDVEITGRTATICGLYPEDFPAASSAILTWLDRLRATSPMARARSTNHLPVACAQIPDRPAAVLSGQDMTITHLAELTTIDMLATD